MKRFWLKCNSRLYTPLLLWTLTKTAITTWLWEGMNLRRGFGGELRCQGRIGLLNDGAGNFSYLPQPCLGLNVVGDVRSIIPIGDQIIFGINDAEVKTLKLR